MPYDLLKQEVAGLSDEKMLILVEFARFLRQGMAVAGFNTFAGLQNSHKRKMGSMAEDFIAISSDFDTCLEGLEDYL